MILGRSFLYVFVMLLPCVGCIHSEGKSSQEKNTLGSYSYAVLVYEYDNKDEWDAYSEKERSVLRSSRLDKEAAAAAIERPKPIIISTEYITITNGVVQNDNKDDRVKITINVSTNSYGVKSSYNHESKKFGKYKVEIFCENLFSPIYTDTYKDSGNGYEKDNEYEWGWWENAPVCVQMENGDYAGLMIYFMLLGDVDKGPTKQERITDVIRVEDKILPSGEVEYFKETAGSNCP